jgi:dGTPase
MSNTFYNTEELKFVRGRFDKTSRTYATAEWDQTDGRSPFECDRDRVTFSAPFRRLQGKTQVLRPGNNDVYRTRLTHSMEVARIGRWVCSFLRKHYDSSKAKNGRHISFNNEYYIDSDLIEFACLSHDIGNPPFGHAGEKRLNLLMQNHGGFEGNAQSLRMVVQILWGTKGMGPTIASMDSILKYKCLLKHKIANEDGSKSKFLYDDQQVDINIIVKGNVNEPLYQTIVKHQELPWYFQSVECQIMDFADDLANSTFDLVDSIRCGLITVEQVEASLKHYSPRLRSIDKLLEAIRADSITAYAQSIIAQTIKRVTLTRREGDYPLVNSERYKYSFKADEDDRARIDALKMIQKKHVYQGNEVIATDCEGAKIIEYVFQGITQFYLNGRSSELVQHDIIQKDRDSVIVAAKSDQQMRLICDHVAGMTDAHINKIFHALLRME